MLEKTYRPDEIEARLYPLWEETGAFAAGAGTRGNAVPYCIMMPPPNVTGSLHMGHALTFTLQDVLTRFFRMRGRDALWQPGTDHAGIATQMVVERQLEAQKLTRHDLGRDSFIKRVWEWKAESGGAITRQLRRLGASPDWTKERFTMDDGLSAAVRKVFVDLYKQGLIYRDKRLVNWDPKLHTAISDLEVEQREIKGKMWHFRYPLEGGAEDQYIVVATTRPETMLGDTAVAVHPEDERYRHLIGRHVVLPIVGRSIPIVGDDYADPTKGSGAVKITPAHDFNDFEVGRRHGLAMINIFDRDARLNDNVPAAYQGLDRFAARDKVLAEMEALGLLDKVEENPMTVPYGDRSGMVIEPWLTDQWFVDAQVLAKPAIEAVEKGHTRFVPKHWENTYFEWMRNIQPWCISRQIWWGHQIPAWYGPDGHVFVEESEEAAAAAARAHYGRDVKLVRDSDVLDTWFSSALWPFSTLGWPERTPELVRYYPTDVLVTGFDIIFFWVARMMMMGIHFMNDVPFRTVYIHALVRDEKGQKMSKSKGNIIDPLDLIGKYGTDALRFTLAAMAAQGRDIKMSEGRVEGYRNFATKLWNAARFAEMNGCVAVLGFDPAGCRQTVNRWIVGKAAEVTQAVTRAFDDYRFNEAASALYQFVWGSYCDWYLEFAKPIFMGGDEPAKAETRAATAWVLERVLHLLHPIMPYITEELWEKAAVTARSHALMLGAWPGNDGVPVDAAAAAEMDWVVEVVTRIRSIRADFGADPGARIKVAAPTADSEVAARIDRHREVIQTLARLSEITAAAAPAGGSVPFVLGGVTFEVMVGTAIKRDEVKARQDKAIKEAKGEIDKLDKKLANPGFLAKAEPEVVEEARDKRARLAADLAKAEDILTRLKNLG